jgi:hypothetical protein
LPLAAVDRDHTVSRINLTHPNEAEIGEVGPPIGVTLCESSQLREVIVALERDGNQAFFGQRRVLQMERRFGGSEAAD